MQRKIFSKKSGGIFLSNWIKKELEEWLYRQIDSQEIVFTEDVDVLVCSVSRLRKEDWFTVAEAVYNYYLSLIIKKGLNICVTLIVHLKQSLTKNEEPSELKLSESTRQWTPPTIGFFRERDREDVERETVARYGGKKSIMLHPFTGDYDVFYCEQKAEDYYDSETKEYLSVPAYDRNVVLIKR